MISFKKFPIKFYQENWIPCQSQPKETTGTCAIWNCDANRGPTDCINGKCLCKDTFFTQDGDTCIPCPLKPGIQLSLQIS